MNRAAMPAAGILFDEHFHECPCQAIESHKLCPITLPLIVGVALVTARDPCQTVLHVLIAGLA
jgi:hypothetical protein